MNPAPDPTPAPPTKCPTGIAGLDDIMRGGLPSDRLYLVRGLPGAGKTTLALQFLLDGARRGERVLYITLSETKSEIEEVARSHRWNLDGIAVFELSALEHQLAQESRNTVFHASEIELNRTTDLLLAEIERVQPRRIALDSLSELRLLADTPLRYRRQLLALKQYFAGKKTTVMLLDDQEADSGDAHVQSISHGVVTVEQLESDYGSVRRRIKINKLRGVDFVGGFHDAIIATGGMQVFPRLIAAEHRTEFDAKPLASGVDGLDQLLGGGLNRGTSTLLLGPAGSGKSTVAMQFACAAAARNEKVFMYLFEENLRVMFERAKSIGMPLQDYRDRGLVVVRQVDPAEMAPGQFVHVVQQNVERDRGRVVIVDSLNGYLQAMPGAKFLVIQLHELLTFLSHHGVVTLMTVAQHGLLGNMQAPVDLTYIADTVVLLRYFEEGGGIRKAFSIVKKRIGRHENTIREFRVTDCGIEVGPPLADFHGVLSGIPVFKGNPGEMLHPRE